jgi:SAM-dependent methyltransferase
MGPAAARLAALPVSDAVSPLDPTYDPAFAHHYRGAGASALLAIEAALAARAGHPDGDAAPTVILDHDCGHGRVTRFLRAAFPEAWIEVAGADPAGVAWCIEQFGCEEMGEAVPRGVYDLIWAGAALTRLAAEPAAALLATLGAALRPGGLLVFASLGRFATARMRDYLARGETGRDFIHFRLPHARALALAEQFDAEGFAHAGGVTLASGEWFARHLGAEDGFLRVSFHEKGWDSSHDVSGFLRADLLDARKPDHYGAAASVTEARMARTVAA